MKNKSKNRIGPREKCPSPEDIVAFVCDGTPSRGRNMAAHLEGCPDCRRWVRDTRRVRQRVAAAAKAPRLEPDLLPGVMARVREAAGHRRHRRATRLFRFPEMGSGGELLRLAVAAGILLVLGFGGMIFFHSASPFDDPDGINTPASREAGAGGGAQWLVRNQSAGGGWDVAEFGGRAEFAPALHGLSILALIGGGQDSESRERAIRKGVRALLKFQSPETGRFGGEGYGSLYNHGIATLALLSACSRFENAEWLPAARRSVGFIRSEQGADGGWGYGTGGRGGRASDTSISAWQLQSLMLARQIGLDASLRPLQKGLAWMGARMRGANIFEYARARKSQEDSRESDSLRIIMSAYCLLVAHPRLSPGGERLVEEAVARLKALQGFVPRDFYEAFFYAAARRVIGPEGSAGVLDTALLSYPARFGTDPEAFAFGEDRWSGVGGRLYNAAMSALVRDPICL